MPRFPHALIFLLLLPVAGSPFARGQAPVGAAGSTAGNTTDAAASTAPAAGTITGTVTDTDGAAISGAQIILTVSTASVGEDADASASSGRKIVTDNEGRFVFADVPLGDYVLSAASPGFASAQIPARLAGEALDLATIVLVAGANEVIQVRPTRFDMAEPDVINEEHQRIGGLLPNFYVVYDWHAPPLATRQKFTLAWRNITDPVNIAANAAIAGIEQADNGFSGYGQGAPGYFKRFGAATGDFTIGTVLGGAVYPILFHQDPRYFYKGTGSIWSRALYALSTAVICRGDSGHWQPNYSSVLGDLSTGAISNIYYPASNRNGAALTFENGLLSALEDGLGNVVQEFLLRHLSPGLPPAKP